MSPRVRKLVGSFVVLAFMSGYIWAATLIAARLPDNQFARLAFYAVAGIGWGVPLFPFITWMQRPR